MGIDYFLIFVFTIGTTVFCFNLEDREPIVKRHDAGSNFGYRVALYKSGNSSDIRNSWLLVGAPLGQNLQQGTNQSGALFKCPIVNFDDQRDCIQIRTDDLRSRDLKYEDDIEEKAAVLLKPPGNDDLSRDKSLYLGPLNDKPELVNQSSYLGMSIAAGKFFYDQDVSYAAGAPRSSDHGQVYIFNNNPPESVMNISLMIDGKQFASNFGYELLAGDFNADGYDDLLVSALTVEKELGGAVYIYYNLRDCDMENCISDLILRGLFETRFGFSLANLGDINQDGYNDLAVGAPYEGNGAIYIYLGSKDGIVETYSQKIHPEWEGVKTLGYSLSGGIDMDNNGYPDLLAGAYDSDAVVLFRTRPIIGIETNVTGVELKHIDMTDLGCGEDRNTPDKCFTFQACFTITSAESGVDNTVIKGVIKEVVHRVSRIWFKQDDPNIRQNFQTRYTTLVGHTKKYCQNETVCLPRNTRDTLTPIKFLINYTIADNTPHSAILNKTSVQEFQATFKKDCGGDDICHSEMVMDARLLVDGEIETTVLNLGTFDEFQIEINVTNKGDPAYEAKVYVEFSDAVRYIDVVNKSRNFICKSNNTLVFCHLGNPLRSTESLSLQLRFENKDIANLSTTNELKFLVFVNSTSVELSNETKTTLSALLIRKALIKLTNPYRTKVVVYGGEVKGESAMKTFDDVGSVVWHSYQVQQLGPMLFADLTWPWQVGNNKPQGKWLLYLEDISIKDGNDIEGNCYINNPPDAVNILNLTKDSIDALPPSNNSNESRDSKTQTLDHSTNEYVVPANTVTGADGKKRQMVTMDCKTNTAKCVTISCDFPKFYKGRLVTILIKSRLWNSTFIEDYSQIEWVRITSYGKISIKDSTIEKDEASLDAIMIETNVYPDLSNKHKATLSALLSRKAIIKLTSPYHTKTVLYGGEIKGESTLKTFDDVGSVVWYYYQVQQLGPMLFADLTVDIEWPWQVGNNKPQGKWLLYLEDISIEDSNDIKGNCYINNPPDAVNILNLTKYSIDALPPSVYINSKESRDSKTQTLDHSTNEYVVPANTLTGADGKKREIVTMDCKANTAKCVTISCDFPKFYKGGLVTILIKSRLWESTFLEDYSQIDWVRIISYGKVSITDPTIEKDEASQDVIMINTNVYPDVEN